MSSDRDALLDDAAPSTTSRLPDDVSPLRRLAIACPALPTCGQALGEAERVLPKVIDELEKLLADTGNEGQAIRVNMTGCPNGCSRPYSAEIGIVGRTKKTYDLYLGGSAGGDRLAQRVRADMPLDELTAHLRPLLERFAADTSVIGLRRLVRCPGRQRHSRPGCRRRPCAAAAHDSLRRRDRIMTVSLVGAGPGDPDLLTVRAARLLAEADVVVHDALVGDGVLAIVAPTAELIDVGKRPGRPIPQEMISALLVELGRQAKRVVRLKGGDPFVFGRGGEEALALQAAGVSFEVVPGITSSVAAPAAAGIPVTHRGMSAAFTVVTGHRRSGEHDVDWRSLAKVGGTIVVLMGVAQRRHDRR